MKKWNEIVIEETSGGLELKLNKLESKVNSLFDSNKDRSFYKKLHSIVVSGIDNLNDFAYSKRKTIENLEPNEVENNSFAAIGMMIGEYFTDHKDIARAQKELIKLEPLMKKHI